MKRFERRRAVYVQRRIFVSFIVFLFAVSLAVPALAEFLGPDRTTTQFVTVRDPDKDVWTITRNPSSVTGPSFCLIIHTCDEHPSVDRQKAVCGWDMGGVNSGCSMAYKTEEQTITLAEATISGSLQNCNLNNGWCTSSPTLHLSANEPLPGESITLIEGTRISEPFACTSNTCDIPLLEGSNSFSFWALSSYGDGSQMGNNSVQVDTVPPSSAFGSPPEGSSVWVSGVLNMSGSSSDAISGVTSAEISLDGGGSWQALSLSGGEWEYSWDTSTVPDGSYQVLVRAQDVAGHLESTASITVHVDLTPPSADLPDEWFIWEPIAIDVGDSGSGVKKAELTIHGGSFGNREYEWEGGNIPGSFLWDRYFGSTVAPIGEYKATLKVWDQLGHSDSASGKVLIPAPPTSAPEPTSIPPTDPAPTSTPHASETTEAAGFVIVSTATAAPATAGSSTGSGGGPAAAPLDDSSSPSSFSDPGAPSTPAGASSGLLWGSAALAAAAAATAYALSRRKAREVEIEGMRAQIAAESSPGAFENRLQRLRKAGAAKAAQILATPRNAYLQAAAAAAVAAKAANEIWAHRQAVDERLPDGGQTKYEELASDPARRDLTTWQPSNPEIETIHRLGRYYASYGTLGLAPSSTIGTSGATANQGINLIPDPEAARRAVAIVEIGDTLLDVVRYSPTNFVYLDSGYIGVRMTELVAPGSKISYRTSLGLAGTRYLPGNIAGFHLRTLGTTAARGLGISMAASILTNLVDFEVGSHRQFGVGSPEFFASTLVDFGVAGLSGLAAAGAVAGVIAVGTALGIGMVATAPAWAAVLIAAGIGAGLVTLADSVTIGGQPALEVLKERVVNGFYAWGGIRNNAQVIGDVVGDRVSQTAEQIAQAVNGAATQAVETVETAVRNVVTGVQTATRDGASRASNTVAEAKGAIQSAAKEVSHAISGAVQKVGDFVGGLFGGN